MVEIPKIKFKINKRDFIETILDWDNNTSRCTQLEALRVTYQRDQEMRKVIEKMLNEVAEKVWKISEGNKCKLNRDSGE